MTIAKGRFQKRQDETGKRLRINERIRISPIRLIDGENNQLGIMDTRRAMDLAREQGLDLVEVAPEAQPPVCRIMDYGKWKYQQKKKEQKAKSNTKSTETKEVRLRPSTEEHDLKIKTNKAEEFFKEGHKVQFTIMFKGRQMAHKNLGFELFDRIIQMFSKIAHVEMGARPQGRRMTMLLAPGVKVVKAGAAPRQAMTAAADIAAEKAQAAKVEGDSAAPEVETPAPQVDTPSEEAKESSAS